MFTESGDTLVYEESGRTAGLRITATVAGLLAFGFSLFFVDLMRRTGVPDTGAKVGGIIASLVALLAFWGFGGYCLYIALFIPLQHMRFDRRTGLVTLTQRSPARGSRTVQHAFADVRRAEIVANVSSDGDSSHEIVLTLASAAPLRIGFFDDRAEAGARLRQIEKILQPGAAVLWTNSTVTRTEPS